jgi:hypothetical protein
MSSVRLLSLVAVLAVVGGLSSLATVQASTTITIHVHYYRFDNTYTNGSLVWDVWEWVQNGSGTPANPPVEFTSSDSFGKVATYTVNCTSCAQLGFIVRVSDWSNREPSTDPASPGNRYLNVTPGTQTSYDVYVVSGDPNNYYTQAAADGAKFSNVSSAKFSGNKHLIVNTTGHPFTLQGGGSGFVLKDLKTHKKIKATAAIDAHNYPAMDAVAVGTFQTAAGNGSNWDPTSTVTRLKKSNGDLWQYNVNLPAGDYQYKIAVGGHWNGPSCPTCAAYPGGNVDLTLNGTELVTFQYVPYLNQVFDSINNSGQPLPLSDPGFATNDIKLTFKTALNTKDKYTISAPGVPTASVK